MYAVPPEHSFDIGWVFDEDLGSSHDSPLVNRAVLVKVFLAILQKTIEVGARFNLVQNITKVRQSFRTWEILKGSDSVGKIFLWVFQ